MGINKYPSPLSRMCYVRMTDPQVNSITAMARAMSLTVGDLIRFAVDELVDDVPEPRMFTRKIHLALGLRASLPRR